MKQIVLPLSVIISLRFLGLFIVLPVLSVYALSLEGANESLIGFAIGGYALTQMLLQVPFGLLSDTIGRKTTLTFGLIIFVLGSLVCAYSSDIYMLIAGRLLQGAGAIGAVAVAMISDMVKEEVRAKALAIMGGSIAVSFAASMVLGPLISGYFGINKLFLLTAVFAIGAIVILYAFVPNPPKITHPYKNDTKQIFAILKDPSLVRMNITNMLQKGMMTLAFLVIPIIMVHDFGYDKKELWVVYVPAMVFGIFAMGFSAVMGEKKKKPREVLILGIILFALAFGTMGLAKTPFVFIIGVMFFFIGFNMHEPIMQSMASKYAKIHQKGVALGVFNSFGYVGTLTGALWGGFVLKHYGIEQIAMIAVGTALLWIVLIITLKNPIFNKNVYLDFGKFDEAKLAVLNSTDGIIEWYKNENEKTLIIKYDAKKVQEAGILTLIG